MNDIFETHRQNRVTLAAMREANRKRASEMLVYRYSQKPPLSYAKVAAKFGVSRQRVEQIVNKHVTLEA